MFSYYCVATIRVMKKERRDHLIDLIHSLTPNEKRYFKLSSTLRANSNHKKLFDVLEGEQSYNAKQVRKKMGNAPVNISYEKKYLQKILLRSIRNFAEDTSIEIQLNQLLIEIELVYNKELTGFCYQLVEQGIKLTEKHELFLYKLHFIKWKRICVKKSGNAKQLAAFLKTEEEQTLDCLHKFSNLVTYKTLHHKVHALVAGRGTVLQKDDKAALLKLMNSPHFKNLSLACTTQAKALFLEAKAWCSHILNNLTDAYAYSKQLVALLEAKKSFIELNPQGYFAALATHYNRCELIGKAEEANALLQKIEQLQTIKTVTLTENLKREIFYFVSERKLIDYAYAFQFQKAIEQAETNKNISNRKKMKLRPSYTLLQYYFTALSHFHLKQYDAALKLLRKIIDEFDDNIRLDFVLFSHLLHLITQYELESTDLLPYLSKSLQRFMKNRKIERLSVDLIIKLLQNLVRNQHDAGACKALFKTFKTDLQKLETNSAENILSETLLLHYWIDSKTYGKVNSVSV